MHPMFFRSACVLVLALLVMPVVVAQEPQHEQVESPDANLAPADFTNIVKDAREFLKNETDAFLKGTDKKTEFETTPEFEKRVEAMRQQYLNNVVKYSTDKKFDKREFGVIFKAKLLSYDADSKTYEITSPTTVEIPYDIPYLQVGMTKNALVAFADSISRGYRSKTMYLKMRPPLHYEVPMDLAKTAKGEQDDLIFRVTLTFDMLQKNFKNQAQITIAAHHIQLMHSKKKTVYWESNL